jgi:hypothetical protein
MFRKAASAAPNSVFSNAGSAINGFCGKSWLLDRLIGHLALDFKWAVPLCVFCMFSVRLGLHTAPPSFCRACISERAFRAMNSSDRGSVWPALLVRRSERCDSVPVAFRQINIVPAVDQLIAADRIDGKWVDTIAARNRLPFEIDAHGLVGIGGDCRRELGGVGFGQDRRQQPILDRVLREDVTKR